MQNQQHVIDCHLKISEEQQRQRLRIFARCTLTEWLEIMRMHREFIYRLKNSNPNEDISILSYIALNFALGEHIRLSGTIESKANKVRAKHEKRNRQREQLLRYWSIVRNLKIEQGLSYRDIATFLKKDKKFEVDHSTIWKLWNELETQEKNIEE